MSQPTPPAATRSAASRTSPFAGGPRRALLLLLVLVSGAMGCDGGGASSRETPVMDREVFVRTYVALREKALLREGGGQMDLPDSLRTAVLDREGVTEDELVRFAEVRGTDIPYMRQVWADIEARLEERRVPLDSLGGS